MQNELTPHSALVVLPHIRVQNANAISSPLTWGFPAITAFTGLMTALSRRLGPATGVRFCSVGVVCHGFQAQVSKGSYTHSFSLTRNPVLQDGSTAAIVEEGRVHLDITLVFEAEISAALLDDTARAQAASQIAECLAGMRIAGGSVMPQLPNQRQRASRARIVLRAAQHDMRTQQSKRLCRQLLPGFALVSRDDLLQTRLAELQASAPVGAAPPSLLDAWLDLSRINHRATRNKVMPQGDEEPTQIVEWITDSRPGWIVPIPVGYAALSHLHPPGSVANARDISLPFRFVESVYSVGQWISPHRLSDVAQMTWRSSYDETAGLYRCVNSYQAPVADSYTPVTFNE